VRLRGGGAAALALAVGTGCIGCTPTAPARPQSAPSSAVATPPTPASPSPTATTPTTPTTPVSTPSPSSAAVCLLPVSTWTAGQLAGAVLIAPARLDDLDAAGPMVASGIGGVVLFGSPAGDVRAALRRLHAAAGAWPLLVASDEEGGDIQRLASLTGALPWPRDLAGQSPAAIRARARTMGRALRALTVRIDLAPVADLDAGPGPDASHPDGKRSFSADPGTASADMLAFARGLFDAGIVPVVKHFPGLGTATANTDARAAVTAPLPVLRARDLLPFAAAARAGLPAVMTSNAVVPGLSPLPVSLSAAAMRLLRHDLGFRGAIITDSLSAGAISAAGFSVGAAAVRALGGGADAVIVGRGDTKDYTALAASVRRSIASAAGTARLPIARLREAVRRLAALMGATTC
jgi:beta-N-acetylhexosaminidase